MISSGRISARVLPPGCAWSDKGSAILVEEGQASEPFLLAYLNSALATYFMKRIVNTTATAHAGYIEKLPYRRPRPEAEQVVVGCVEQIIEALKGDPAAEIQPLRDEIDDHIFDLFEIRSVRDEVRRFYASVGRAEPTDAQAASE